jgi:replication initiation protein RepC
MEGPMESTPIHFAPGLRRLTPGQVAATAAAERFGGLPPGVSRGRILAIFKRAASALGIPPRLRDAIDVLMAFSQDQDWQAGQRPIVWPSNALLQDQLGLCRRQVQYLIRGLIDLRLIAPMDSPTGRRWGRRNPKSGVIVEAYGFDLSPLAERYEELLAAAEQNQAERERRGRLRRRLTVAVKAIRQIVETALDHGVTGRDWLQWLREAEALVVQANDALLPDLEASVAGLERQRQEGEAALQAVFAVDEMKDIAPSGALCCTPITTTNQLPADQSATCKADPKQSTDPKGATSIINKPAAPASLELEEHKISPWFILKVSPALKPYIVSVKPTWAHIVDAADWVRGDLGISRHAWIEACMTMGRYNAAVAIAVIAAKANEIRSAGGYLRAMTERARQGSLHLGKSVYGLAERQRQQQT